MNGVAPLLFEAPVPARKPVTEGCIVIEVAGIPKGQPRVRAFVRGHHAGVYDPGTADDWKACVYLAAREHKPTTPITGPVRVDVTLLFPRPKYLMRPRSPEGRILHTAKPDRDNCDKAILDSLVQAGVLSDDALACSGEIQKWYAAKGERSGAFIQIQTIG